MIGVVVRLIALLTAAASAYGANTIRVGLIQINARELDKAYNMAQIEAGVRAAAARGAQIICTPEAAVQGYPRVDLPPGKPPDAADLAEKRSRILSAAEPIPGPATTRLARLAKELGVWIVFGRMRIVVASCSIPPS
jgi:N-carbamoylputrescine amidase